MLGLTFEIDRVVRALAIAREEFAFRFLTDHDWLELGRTLYRGAPKYTHGSAHNESGLFAFEREAIEREFPSPPASILVGACGGGRELFALLAQGYRVAAAYDPVPTFIDALREDPRLVEAKQRLCVGYHQGVATLDPIVALRRTGATIDAVVVGWGSYTHLLRTECRISFLRALRSLCPQGPVLLSFFVAVGGEEERPQRLRSRLRRLLGTTGALVEPGDALHRGAGGIHYFTEVSFAAEVAHAGYRVQLWQEHDFAAAHAVLVPANREMAR